MCGGGGDGITKVNFTKEGRTIKKQTLNSGKDRERGGETRRGGERERDLVGILSPVNHKGLHRAKNNVQSVSYLLCTQVITPQIIQKPQNQS